jgi:LPXTG-motif cell wall-anchored protein
MKNAKSRVIGVMVLTLLMSLFMTSSAFAAEKFTIHAKTPAAWTEPGLWAWSAPDGTNVFEAWPGEKLVEDETNEGWLSYELPGWVNSIIINEGVDGGGQTADVNVEAKELWITVADDFSTTVAYEAPAGFTAAKATSDAAASTDMPKTGVVSAAGIWLGAAALSGIGAMAAKRKKTK